MPLIEKFQQPTLPPAFHWLNPPDRYQLGAGLEIFTDEKTDFWQKTHYGFQRDDGHCLFTSQAGDFCLLTHVEFRPQTQYDQCGLDGAARSGQLDQSLDRIRERRHAAAWVRW